MREFNCELVISLILLLLTNYLGKCYVLLLQKIRKASIVYKEENPKENSMFAQKFNTINAITPHQPSAFEHNPFHSEIIAPIDIIAFLPTNSSHYLSILYSYRY